MEKQEPGNNELRLLSVSNSEEFAVLRSIWNHVLERSSDKAVTQTWEWLHTWWTTYGGERELRIVVGYQNDEPIGVAPFSMPKTSMRYYGLLPYKTIWFIGGGKTRDRNVVSDYLNIIVAEGKENVFVIGLLKWLSRTNDWDEIILENISSESRIPGLLYRAAQQCNIRYQVLNSAPSIVIKLPDSWEKYLESISGSLRYRIVRGRKEFQKLKGEYVKVLTENELDSAFNRLEMLHQNRWEGKAESGAFASASWKKFHKALIDLAFRNGWLDLSFLNLEGKPVAANYNFLFDGNVHFFQSGLIPHENKHIRLGLILHSYCIEDAIRRGMREYDFLRVGSSGAGYKESWGNYSRTLYDIRLSKPGPKETLYEAFCACLQFLRRTKYALDLQLHKGTFRCA